MQQLNIIATSLAGRSVYRMLHHLSSFKWLFFILTSHLSFIVLLCSSHWHSLRASVCFQSLSMLSFLGFSRSDLSHLTGPNSVCLLDLDMPCSAICFPRLNCFEWLISHLSSHMALKSLSISVFDIHSVLVSLHPLFLILTPLFFSVFSSQVSWTSQCGPQWSSMDPSYLLLSEWPKLFWTGLTLLPVLGVLFLSNESESCHFLKETTHR